MEDSGLRDGFGRVEFGRVHHQNLLAGRLRDAPASQAHAARHAHGVRLRDDSKEGGKCGRAYPAILYVGQALDTIRTNMNACQDEHERLRALDRDRLAREDELALHIGDARVKEQDDIVEHRGSPVQERAVVAEGRVQLDEVGCKK